MTCKGIETLLLTSMIATGNQCNYISEVEFYQFLVAFLFGCHFEINTNFLRSIDHIHIFNLNLYGSVTTSGISRTYPEFRR